MNKLLNITGALLLFSVLFLFFVMGIDLYKAIKEPYTVYATYTYITNSSRTVYYVNQRDGKPHFMNCVRNTRDSYYSFDTTTNLYKLGDTVNLKQVKVNHE
jgi:hypothetical protein